MRVPVSLKSPEDFIICKLVNLADWCSRGRWQLVPAQTVDSLRSEINQLERNLAHAPTRPTRLVRQTKPLEPITEQQKIMDLAG
jgi:hypothetical protein